MLGAYFCIKNYLVLGGVFFTCALNFKQMNLYFALAFFAFILG
jgi:hypothetical protein